MIRLSVWCTLSKDELDVAMQIHTSRLGAQESAQTRLVVGPRPLPSVAIPEVYEVVQSWQGHTHHALVGLGASRQRLLPQEGLSVTRHVRKVIIHNVHLHHSVVRVEQCLQQTQPIRHIRTHAHTHIACLTTCTVPLRGTW